MDVKLKCIAFVAAVYPVENFFRRLGARSLWLEKHKMSVPVRYKLF